MSLSLICKMFNCTSEYMFQYGGSSFPIRFSKSMESQDDNEDEDDIEELERKLRAAELPDHALKVAMKEIKV